MNCGFAGYICDFLKMPEEALIGQLIKGVASTGVDQHRNSQINAWRE